MKQKKNKRLFLLIKLHLFLIILLNAIISNIFALSIIRDEEIESTLIELAQPILNASNLNQQSIKFYLIDSKEINAYIINAQYLFIYAGMIKNIPNANALAGVIAHECAHIAAGHVIKTHHEMELAGKKMLLSSIIGIITGITSGNTEAAIGTIAATTHSTHLGMMKYSRIQEHAADKLALLYLLKSNISPKSFINYFKSMEQKERTFITTKDTYYLTHPISKERIKYLNRSFHNKEPQDYSFPDIQLRKKFALMKAKVEAIITPPKDTLLKYKNNDMEEAIYARSIAYYMKHDYLNAIKEIDLLMAKKPSSPYFHETKAQFLFEGGKIQESIVEYKKALNLKPTSQLFKIELASAIISSKKKDLQENAIALLKQVCENEKNLPVVWHELGKAYHIINMPLESNISFAKAAILNQDKKTAKNFILKAKKTLKQSSKSQTLQNEISSLENELNF